MLFKKTKELQKQIDELKKKNDRLEKHIIHIKEQTFNVQRVFSAVADRSPIYYYLHRSELYATSPGGLTRVVKNGYASTCQATVQRNLKNDEYEVCYTDATGNVVNPDAYTHLSEATDDQIKKFKQDKTNHLRKIRDEANEKLKKAIKESSDD